jgi:hypothetical protein
MAISDPRNWAPPLNFSKRLGQMTATKRMEINFEKSTNEADKRREEEEK